MNKYLLALSKTFKTRGFDAYICDNIGQANDVIENIVNVCGTINSIGFGNSITLKTMGLHELLSKYTQNIYIHSPVGTEDTDRMALTSDVYLTSANAISLDGHIVNIDGTGNRTAATCFGPRQVIYVIGKNKLTNTLDEAITRAKSAAVELAKRYDRKTPCVITGKCEDCISPECICAVTTIHRKKPYGVNISLILLDIEIGI